MRRVVGMIVSVVVLAAMAPAGAQPGAGAGAEQYALAAWVHMTGDTGTFVAADAFRYADEAGLHSMGGVAKGTCTRSRSKGWVITVCSASGRMKEVGLEGYQMDPALRTAHLEVALKGQTHTVDWTGEDPYLGEGAFVGPGGAAVGAGADAWAKARAKVFGKKYSKRCWFCLLGEAAGAAVFATTGTPLELSSGTDHVSLTTDGDLYHLQLTRKVRA